MRTFVKSLFMSFVPLIGLYLLMPLLIFTFPTFFQKLFFLSVVKLPFVDYNNLTAHGVNGGYNFYLKINGTNGAESEKLGVWHILPTSQHDQLPANFTDEQLKQLVQTSNNPIVVYLHGNSFDRTSLHRCELYRLLAALDYHVFAIDYEGYGDSTGRPTELSVVEDAKAIYKYARELSSNKKDVYIWGHSMGTAVASKATAELTMSGIPPSALVLEAPFNNLHDVISASLFFVLNHPFSVPFRFLPWFESTVIQPLIRSGLVMQSDEHIKHIGCPLLVFHAQDDHIIPVKLGRKLVEVAQSAGKVVKYVEFDASRNFLHKYIHRAEELPSIVK
ncbi:2-arachidonoylglycerol hydrolase ABHD12 [Aphelenchoides besseyi]|nr:2-arachidonoylglycerol hydrolase ABHD12 [Aphelenchoides besseyi]